ncbi:unnamed protein product [Closterium sp. Naga37s-1]|nr:unnamed protein product [Closterium sp. Naga37s-1]
MPVPGFKGSLLDFVMRETEVLHGKVRRYTSPTERPFFPDAIPPLILPPLNYPRVRRMHGISFDSQFSVRAHSLPLRATTPLPPPTLSPSRHVLSLPSCRDSPLRRPRSLLPTTHALPPSIAHAHCPYSAHAHFPPSPRLTPCPSPSLIPLRRLCSIPIPSLPIPHLPIPSLPIPHLPIPSLPIPHLPIPSLPIPHLPIPASPSLPSPSLPSPSLTSQSLNLPSLFSPSLFSPSLFSPSLFSPSLPSPSLTSPFRMLVVGSTTTRYDK